MSRYSYDNDNISQELKDKLCPLTITQNAIAGRWKIVILWHLSEKTTRLNELLRLIPGISKGILRKQLRELEDDGLIERTVYPEVPPKVEYALSEAGEQFLPVLDAMRIWGQKRMKELTIIE